MFWKTIKIFIRLKVDEIFDFIKIVIPTAIIVSFATLSLAILVFCLMWLMGKILPQVNDSSSFLERGFPYFLLLFFIVIISVTIYNFSKDSIKWIKNNWEKARRIAKGEITY